MSVPAKCKSKDFIYVPEGFDPSQYPGPIAKHPDAARWLLNCVYFWRITRKYGVEDYINLHSDLLALVMGDQALVRPIREALKKNGLLEDDGQVVRGSKSLGYRLGPKLRDVTFREFTSTNKRFMKRVAKFKAYVNERQGFTLPVHYHLEKFLTQVSLSPDWEDSLLDMDVDKAAIAYSQARLIIEGFIRKKVCDYGRLHTNHTSLCRELRKCLEFNGERLVEVDIRNSQIYFLMMLLLSIRLSSSNSSCLTSRIFDYMHECVKEQEERNKRTQELLPYPHVFGLEDDFERMLRVVLEGKFYESFIPDLDNRRDIEEARDKIKPQVFSIIFGTIWTMDHSELAPRFKELYPTAWTMMRQLKKEHGFRWLAQEMQRRESEIVIGRVCGRIMTESPNIPILTIHDSLMTTPRYMPYVRAVLLQELSHANLYVPQLRMKTTSVPLEAQEGTVEAILAEAWVPEPTEERDAPEPVYEPGSDEGFFDE